jgi:hypothetical protein
MTTVHRPTPTFLAIVSCLVFAAIGCVPAFSWQTTSKQPQSTVHLEDNSDWWSITREDTDAEHITFQERELSRGNFQILGIHLDEGLFRRAEGEFGGATSVERGDASTARAQLCYVSIGEATNTYLIFETGEVNNTFYLFNAGPAWKGNDKCVATKVPISGASTISGLHLGLIPSQVIDILGKPTIRREDQLSYYVHARKKTSEVDLKRIRQQHSEMSDKEFADNYAFYDLTAMIVMRFKDSRLNYLAVSELETY